MKKLLPALCLLAASTCWAGIGTVTENKGDSCSIQRGKEKMSGTKGAGIESNDTYVTGVCASNITFKDETKVKITENSRLVIDDFVFDPKASDAGKLAMKVGMGTVRYASGQIAKNNPQQVAIKTPTASIAVRGTDFSMTVDETGQSLIMLLPSCKEEKEMKQYELDEQRCRVGQIEVSNNQGTVILDKAFEATYVISHTIPPTAPAVVNTVESNVNNSLILVHPHEIIKAIRDTTGKTKKEELDAEIEAEAQRRLAQKVKEGWEDIERAKLLESGIEGGSKTCNPYQTICVSWERPGETSIQSRGKGVAFRITDTEHYAEVKTEGYSSNTFVSITQNDNYSSVLIGDGSPGGNTVTIKQNTGVLRAGR